MMKRMEKNDCCFVAFCTYVVFVNLQRGSQGNLLLLESEKTFKTAVDVCRNILNGSLVDVDSRDSQTKDLVAKCIGDGNSAWSGRYSLISTWLSIQGCVEVDNSSRKNIWTLTTTSVFECHQKCIDDMFFAIKDLSCVCLSSALSIRGDGTMCDNLCKNGGYCGGNMYYTLYKRVTPNFETDAAEYRCAAQVCGDCGYVYCGYKSIPMDCGLKSAMPFCSGGNKLDVLSNWYTSMDQCLDKFGNFLGGVDDFKSSCKESEQPFWSSFYRDELFTYIGDVDVTDLDIYRVGVFKVTVGGLLQVNVQYKESEKRLVLCQTDAENISSIPYRHCGVQEKTLTENSLMTTAFHTRTSSSTANNSMPRDEARDVVFYSTDGTVMGTQLSDITLYGIIAGASLTVIGVTVLIAVLFYRKRRQRAFRTYKLQTTSENIPLADYDVYPEGEAENGRESIKSRKMNGAKRNENLDEEELYNHLHEKGGVVNDERDTYDNADMRWDMPENTYDTANQGNINLSHDKRGVLNDESDTYDHAEITRSGIPENTYDTAIQGHGKLVSNDPKPKTDKALREEDLYNHLHETEGVVNDQSDTYDFADIRGDISENTYDTANQGHGKFVSNDPKPKTDKALRDYTTENTYDTANQVHSNM